jgi:PAS domain S-box-containing protein
MKRVRLSIQIALSLGVLSATVLLAAKAFGLLPDQRKAAIETRIALSENLAITSSVLANRKQWDGIKLTLRELHARNPDVLSAALRRLDDRVMADVGGHESTWRHTPDRKSTEIQVYVPIMQGKTRWGTLEVAFRPIGVPGWPSWLDVSLWRLIIFAVAANSLLFWLYLRRVLCELDPSRVMPQRVRSAFDALTEGLIVLDNAGRIVLANQAFAATLGRTPEELLGTEATNLPFQTNSAGSQRPWEQVHSPSVTHSGVEMTLSTSPNATRTFFVNAAPIEDQKGSARGFLASFAEITQLEQHKHELLKMLDALRESRDKICQQNDELSYLATRDSLTGCLNRRSFFEQFERSWQQGNLGELACIMTDIDKFKSINDNHGHSMGDEVLKRVAGELLNSIGSEGLVCRYGGEEFCVVLSVGALKGASHERL